jgi:MFS family permease
MQSVALHWHVYLLTGSPLALGFVGLTRALPTILFSLWGGVVADRRDRRAVMLAAQSVMTVGALALAGLTVTHRETLVALYLLNALGAAAGAFDNPSRQALIPRLVPVADLPGALALNLAMFQTAQIAGPALAGLLIAGGTHGLFAGGASHAGGAVVAGGTGALALIYCLNALSFLGVLGVLATLTTSGKVEAPAGTRESPLAAMREGLRFVFTTPIMVWTTALDFVATFFAGSMSLLPIVADQVLHVGPAGYGVLVAAPATGALLGALYTSTWPLPARQGRLLLASVAAYGLATVAFGRRPGRSRLDRHPPDAAPAHHPGPAAWADDLRQHDLLHRRSAARRGGGGVRGVPVCDRRHRRHGFDRDRRPGHRSRGGRGRSRHARGPGLRAAPGLIASRRGARPCGGASPAARPNALHCNAGGSSR